MKLGLISLVLALGLSPMTVSCGGKKKKHNAAAVLPAPSKFFVHGDPMEMIQGTVKDNTGLVDLENMPSLDGFALNGYFVLAQIVEKDKVKPITNQTRAGRRKQHERKQLRSIYK